MKDKFKQIVEIFNKYGIQYYMDKSNYAFYLPETDHFGSILRMILFYINEDINSINYYFNGENVKLKINDYTEFLKGLEVFSFSSRHLDFWDDMMMELYLL